MRPESLLSDNLSEYAGSGVQRIATPSEGLSGGFLSHLERREDLQWLCVRLVSDALYARDLADTRARHGDPAEAGRCRAFARKAARHAARFLEEYREENRRSS